MKPIETKYKGYRFRSRTEARWGVFFDSLGITWEYEPEGFEFDDGTRYLPDFLLKGVIYEAEYGDKKRLDIYVEVKPAQSSEEDWAKAKILSNHELVLLLAGTPKKGRVDTLCGPDNCLGWYGWYATNSPPAIEKAFAFVSFFAKNEISIHSTVDRRSYTVDAAVEAARSARFEFGECGVAA